MTTAVAMVNGLDREKVELIKQTVAKGATDLELDLFMHACKRTGLDPLMKQIYAIKRWNTAEKKEVMSFQTGIDGYRLIADRTGMYAPGKAPEFHYDSNNQVFSATAFVKKKTADGQWHECSATAYWDEYVQTNKEGRPTAMWLKMPHLMLAKCAEALALRQAFPAELSGVYTHEEMMQADSEPKVVVEAAPAVTLAAPALESLPPAATDSQVPTSGGDSPKFPFGPWKGKPLTVVPMGELQSAMDFINRTIDDPKKAKFRQTNEEMVFAIQEEMMRREEHVEMEAQ